MADSSIFNISSSNNELLDNNSSNSNNGSNPLFNETVGSFGNGSVGGGVGAGSDSGNGGNSSFNPLLFIIPVAFGKWGS